MYIFFFDPFIISVHIFVNNRTTTFIFFYLTGNALFPCNIAFHAIQLDALFDENSRDWSTIRDLVSAGIKRGVVTPLRCTVFDKLQVKDAFRCVTQEKPQGKVVIKVGYCLRFFSFKDFFLFYTCLL
jgi:hypothetical protein